MEVTIVGRQLVDPVDLFSDIGQVEVCGERPDQGDHVLKVELTKELVEVGPCGFRAAPPRRLAESPYLFNEVEEVLSVLADESISQLVAEPADVGTEDLVAIRFSGGHGHNPGSTLNDMP
jgi:hypothetical protein